MVKCKLRNDTYHNRVFHLSDIFYKLVAKTPQNFSAMKYLFIICISLVSCARVPIQAVQLSQALQEEANRMHRLNLALVDNMFAEKTVRINEFMQTEYTPAYIENFKKKLPPNTDFKADFEEMMEAIYPRINATKDSLTTVLQNQRTTIVDKLNLDYQVFSSAFNDLELLLKSANRKDQQKTDVYAQLKTLTGNRLDLASIDNALNGFITGGGNIAAKALTLSSTIQSLLK